jgi:nucleotide-binding universal stress UspA family protein
MAKTLVGYDGTKGGDDALALASQLAGTGELFVLSAWELPFLGPWEIAAVGERGAAAAGEQLAEEHLGEVLGRAAARLADRKFESRRSHLPAADALITAALADAVDLVVVGPSEHGPVGRVLLGSVGLSLLGRCPRPVVIAPSGWAGGERQRVDLIGIAYDGSRESRAALSAAADLAAELDAALRLIGVVDIGVVDATAADAGDAARLEAEEMQAAAAGLSGPMSVDYVVAEGTPAETLVAGAQTVDLLALGTRSQGPLRRAMLGSVARSLVERAPCPLLVVPRAAAESLLPAADLASGERSP